MTINLFRNPSFELGTHQPGSKLELNIPNEWLFHYADYTEPNPHDPADHSKFVMPEVRVLDRSDLPEHEHDLFILHGDHTLKIFKRSGSWWGTLYQVAELPTGTFRATVNIFGDLVKAYDGDRKVWADDPAGRDGLFRFVIHDQPTTWLPIKPGDWNTYTHEFTQESRTTALGIEIMCPFALVNNCIFADLWELTQIAKPPPIPTEEEAVAIFRKTWREIFPNS
jgi:hypothetical protein